MKKIKNQKEKGNSLTKKKPFLPVACSCMTLTSKTGKHYWYRTCDIETRIWEDGAHVVCLAKGGTILYGDGKTEISRYSFLGITYNSNDTWLLDGVNEEGLAGGLLMLYEGTSVEKAEAKKEGYIGMELVTKLLSSCKDVDEVKKKAMQIQILDVPAGKDTFSASMHYFFTDKRGDEVVLEAVDKENSGMLQIYDRKDIIGVMTNSPPYKEQIQNLEWFMANSPELRYGTKGQSLSHLEFDGRVLKPNKKARHISLTATFPGSYCSYDRFLRLAVMKALSDCGNHWADEEMLAKGSQVMNVVAEPDSKGVFHYTRVEADGTVVGQKRSYTQYLVMYDIEEKCFYIKVVDEVSWIKFSLKDLPEGKKEIYEVISNPLRGIILGNP